MIDRCKDIIFYNRDEEMNKVLSKPIFNFQKEVFSKVTGEPIHLYDLFNLRVKSYPMSKKIIAENSLHKLRHENNYCDFTFSELSETCDFLSDTFEKRTDEMRVLNFEFGLILNTPEKPNFYFDKFNSIRLKPFYYLPPPANQSKPLEKYCPFTQYTVKYYDTGTWNGVKEEYLLKGEIRFKKMQKVLELTGRNSFRSPITISDFTDKRFLGTMAEFHLNTYRSIDKLPIAVSNQFKPRQREFLFAGANPEYWLNEKRINPNTAKKKRAEYLQLCKQVLETGGGEPYKELERLFQSKFEYLINN